MAGAQPTVLLEKIRAWEADGQSDSLDRYYPQLADAYREQDQLADFLYAHWDWQAYWFDDSSKALGILDSALARQWRPPAGAEEGEALLWVHLNRGYHLGALGKILPSIEAYETALEWYGQYGFDFFDAVDYLFLPLGAHYTRLGDNEKAQGIYLQAIPIAETHQDAESLAGLYNNLGLTYWNAGQYERALEVYRRGLSLTGLSPLRTGLLNLSIAQCLFDLDAYPEAERSLQSAEKYLKTAEASEAKADYLSGVHKLRGDLYRGQERYALAEQAFSEALEWGRQVYGGQPSRDVGKIYIGWGWLYLQQNRFAEALTAFNRAITEVLPAFQPASADENPDPEQLYEENTLLEALAGKAETYRQAHLAERSPQLLENALNCYDLAYGVETKLRAGFQYESSKLTLLADSRRRTENALAIILELYRRTPGQALGYRALEWMERAKATVLFDALQDNLARNAIESSDTLLQRERTLAQQLAFFERQLILHPESEQGAEWRREKFQVEQQLNQVGARLRDKYPRLQNFRSRENRLDQERFHRLFLSSPSSVYLSYFVGEEALYGLAIGGDGAAQFRRLGAADSLRNQVFRFLRVFARPGGEIDPQQYQLLAGGLSEKLLAPLLPSGALTSGVLCIAPDAWLGALPFEGLLHPGGQENGKTWPGIDYLLRHYRVHYVFSAAVATLQAQTNSGARKTARLIAPLFPAGERNLAPLPGSRQELAAIAPPRSQQLIGAAADRDRVIAQIGQYQLLHFSTHAQADSIGFGSRIELYDQPLYLPDIYALRLQARLVVLSACESGAGRVEKGEGVMSLSRAFTYAGANALVSSLWSVNAQATTNLMKRFYRGLRDKEGAAEALHQAKIDYLDGDSISSLYKSPYYWAGFVYIGPPEMTLEFSGASWSGPVNWLAAGALLLLMAGWWFRRRRAMKPGSDKNHASM